MIRVIFVDDEPLVLRGIERSLRQLRPGWTVTYAETAAQAQTVLERETFDVIVSDVGMPVMDGIALLRAVRERYPHMARLILSGEANPTDRMRGVLEIHQWLAKPTPMRELVAVIERTCAPRESIADAGALAAICGIVCLQSGPSFHRAVAPALEHGAPLADLIRLVGRDVAMSAKLVQLVNGAFFGTPGRITSVRIAAETLGVDRVRAILAGAEVAVRPDVDALSVRAIFIAELARSVAVDHHDDVYLAGLLHDVSSFTLGRTGRTASPPAESALLLATWGLPPEVVQAVAFHREPNRASDPLEPRLCSLARAAVLADELLAVA